jgi:prepilin-type N-terminal cleavage/methylation domain-containing protein
MRFQHFDQNPCISVHIRERKTMLRGSRKGSRSRRAFTLIEMLVVIGMLGILMGVTFGGVGRARSRARVAKAHTEVRELVNAILACEAAEGELDLAASPTDAMSGEAVIQKLLGNLNSGKPVYLNAPIPAGAFRDPWGTPYRYRIVGKAVSSAAGTSERVSATVTFPNRGRGIR